MPWRSILLLVLFAAWVRLRAQPRRSRAGRRAPAPRRRRRHRLREAGRRPADTVGLRYHLRVNASSGHVNRKLVFFGIRTATPAAPASHDRHGRRDRLARVRRRLGHAGWPEQGLRHPDEPSLWLRNVDYHGVGRVGLQPTTAAARWLFPRQCAGIDRTTPEHAAITSIAAIHQARSSAATSS